MNTTREHTRPAESTPHMWEGLTRIETPVPYTPSNPENTPTIPQIFEGAHPVDQKIFEARQRLQTYEDNKLLKELLVRPLEQPETSPAETEQQKPQSRWQRLKTGVAHLTEKIKTKVDRIVHDPEERKQFFKTLAEEGYAFAVGAGVKTAVILTGSTLAIVAGGVTLAALPLAAVGSVAAGVAIEAFKNRDVLMGKTSGREYFRRELGKDSYRNGVQVEFQGTPNEEFKVTGTKAENKKGQLALWYRTLTRGLKDRAIETQFKTKETEAKLKAQQTEVGPNTLSTFDKLLGKAQVELPEATGEQLLKQIATYAVEDIKTAKHALDTTREKAVRVLARKNIKDMYALLREVTYVVTTENPHKANKEELKAIMNQINTELNAQAQSAVKKSIVAAAPHQLVKYTGGTLFVGGIHKAYTAVADIFHPPTAYAADIATTRTVQKVYMPIIGQKPPVDPVETVKPTLEFKPVNTAKIIAPELDIATSRAPQVVEHTITIKKGEWFFPALAHNGFDIERKGSAQRFMDQIAPQFVHKGQVTEKQIGQLKLLLKGKDANHSLEWLRWTYNQKYGKDKFDTIFMVHPQDKITYTTTSIAYSPKTNEHLGLGFTPIRPETTAQKLPQVNLQAREQTPQLSTNPVAPRRLNPAAELQLGFMPVQNTALNTTPLEIAPQAVVAPSVATGVFELVGLPKESKTNAFSIFHPENHATHPITISVNKEAEQIFQLDKSWPIEQWDVGPSWSSPEINHVNFYIDPFTGTAELGGHTASTAVIDAQGNKIIQKQIFEALRYWMERAFGDSARLSEIQIEKNLQELIDKYHLRMTFTQDGIKKTYKMVDYAYLKPNEIYQISQHPDMITKQKDALLVYLCGRSQADAYKMLNMTSGSIPTEIRSALDVIQNRKQGSIKEAIDTITKWYEEQISPQDTTEVLTDLKGSTPELADTANILLDPNATDEQIKTAGETFKEYLKSQDTYKYELYDLFYEALGHSKDREFMQYFHEYISWTRPTLVLIPDEATS